MHDSDTPTAPGPPTRPTAPGPLGVGGGSPTQQDVAGHAVITRGLTKTYRTRSGVRTAVGGLDLDVPTGGVHGFLGPNGSGKTTTIRMLLGLVRHGGGTMHIFGHEVPADLPAVIDRVGAIVESPRFFPHFTGRKNLTLLADAIGTPRGRVGEVLDEVELGSRGEDAFKTYSLGMKQRLAIAATLLKSPDLLIFDEPTNGLDPAGIQEVRQTMRTLGQSGRTVLVSSHILSEVEQVADTVSIIGRGKVLAQGPVAELISTGGAETFEVGIGASERERSTELLRGAGWQIIESTTDHHGSTTLVLAGPEDPAQIVKVLADEGVYLIRLLPRRRGLESVFLELTGSHTPATDAAATSADGGVR